MQSSELEENFNSILHGQLRGAEIVLGLVGAVGADLPRVVIEIETLLKKYQYDAVPIRVSQLIQLLVDVPESDQIPEPARSNTFMDKGDEARITTGNNAILALAAAAEIFGHRKEGEEQKPRTAFIVNSLKHPEEVNALRRIYGSGFYLIGVYVDEAQRKKNLVNRFLCNHPQKADELVQSEASTEAIKLMRRDESEGPSHGQRTRDTYHLSDFFVHVDAPHTLNEQGGLRTGKSVERILDLIFADPYRTPLFDEYAMFMAFAAAARSADLSRQIGAVIACGEEVLATGVNECPRFGGGTYWPKLQPDGMVLDLPGGRDYKRQKDNNDQEKSDIVEVTLELIKKTFKSASRESPDEGLLREAFASSPIDDLTEYGRVVHAEMDALLTCARNTISCRGATLYTTTFPCHNCAKHIIAAGIERVVYIEPYPKSKALKFHDDSSFSGFRTETGESLMNKVAFEPFVGVGPRRYLDLFSMRQGSGFPLVRKDKRTGSILHWNPEDGTIRMPMLPWNYLQRELIAVTILEPSLRGQEHEQPGTQQD